jgi:hypothetical protein
MPALFSLPLVLLHRPGRPLVIVMRQESGGMAVSHVRILAGEDRCLAAQPNQSC